MTEIEHYEHGACLITLEYDEDASSPRDDCNLGVMACNHRDYHLGDEDALNLFRKVEEWAEERSVEVEEGDQVTTLGPQPWDGNLTMSLIIEYLKTERGATVVLPLGLYDHSGITMFVGARGDYPFDSDGWDTSNVGVIFDTTESREECGTPLELIEECLRGEVETYDDYLRGNVCGYVVTRDGKVIDSCWGFIGDEGMKYAKQEAESSADHENKSLMGSLAFYEMAH